MLAANSLPILEPFDVKTWPKILIGVPSLKKLKIDPQRWSYNLIYPFHLQHSECKAMATEARNISKALDKLASEEAQTAFDEKNTESIEKGSGFLHKFAKDEKGMTQLS